MSNAYPFDPSGTLPSNRIVNEVHTVTGLVGTNSFLIVPFSGPFYGNSLRIVNSSGLTLAEGVDYHLSHNWGQASKAVGLQVYGSITLLGSTPNGSYRVNYQTIGGETVIAKANTIQDGLVSIANYYIDIDWSTAPVAFPPAPHTANLAGMNGALPIYQGLLNIAAALRSPKTGVTYDDVLGADDVYAHGYIMPLMDIVNSINTVNQSFGTALTDLISANLQSQTYSSIPPNLQSYTIPLSGIFQLKVGGIYYDPGAQFTILPFTGQPFPNQCLFLYCWGGCTSPEVGVCNDTVYWGYPSTSEATIKIVPDITITTQRVLRYIALGC